MAYIRGGGDAYIRDVYWELSYVFGGRIFEGGGLYTGGVLMGFYGIHFLDKADHFRLKYRCSDKLSLIDVSHFKIDECSSEFCIYIINNGLIKTVAKKYSNKKVFVFPFNTIYIHI